MDVKRCIEIIQRSNELLEKQVEKLKIEYNKGKIQKYDLEEEYYNVLSNCEEELEATRFAINILKQYL